MNVKGLARGSQCVRMNPDFSFSMVLWTSSLWQKIRKFPCGIYWDTWGCCRLLVFKIHIVFIELGGSLRTISKGCSFTCPALCGCTSAGTPTCGRCSSYHVLSAVEHLSQRACCGSPVGCLDWWPELLPGMIWWQVPKAMAEMAGFVRPAGEKWS